MKFNEGLDRLDHHYQMIALWEETQRHMQQSVDVPQKNIPVVPSVRNTLVTAEVVRQAQEKVKEQIDYHKKMAEQYGESVLNPKTLPKEGGPAKEEAPPKKNGKAVKTVAKKEAKPTPAPAPAAEVPAPAAAEPKEAENG